MKSSVKFSKPGDIPTLEECESNMSSEVVSRFKDEIHWLKVEKDCLEARTHHFVSSLTIGSSEVLDSAQIEKILAYDSGLLNGEIPIDDWLVVNESSRDDHQSHPQSSEGL